MKNIHLPITILFQFIGIAIVGTRPEPIHGTVIFLAATALQAYYHFTALKYEKQEETLVEEFSKYKKIVDGLQTSAAMLFGQ